ncbi:DinB family protein [Streptomyces sp. AV19]|uniref:DinB family protein n=1 Tax=Streptomyces sp. AV19 TaxID=2793068 RepID=UPI0018FE8058|nr:DinB family protein [Streptomyces sp. AV19]MBH1936019.1 DinB family protein [Streptomyces sp. AV19]MDG4534189.1 DinB family protein [Streptomyces sp. AV19]
MTTLPDGRPVPPPQAGEREALESWLDFHRATLELKCRGLDDEQLRRAAVPPSPMSLLGLVQHMAVVERNWFQRVFARRDVPVVAPEAGFALDPGPGLDEALAAWRAEIAAGRELMADASLDDVGRLSGEEGKALGSEEVSLRWILIHLIEEYARHNGHADLIRECVDGTTGA